MSRRSTRDSRDLGGASSARGAPTPTCRSPAIVGGPGDHLRARATVLATPPAPAVRHTADAPALARRPGETTLDLPEARAGTTADPTHIRALVLRLAAENPDWDTGASPGRSPDQAEGVPSHRLGDLEEGRLRSSAPAQRPELGSVPQDSGVRDLGLRLLQRRDGHARATVLLGCGRACHAAGPRPGCHGEPDGPLGRAAKARHRRAPRHVQKIWTIQTMCPRGDTAESQASRVGIGLEHLVRVVPGA
jgi:hypothetical protein